MQIESAVTQARFTRDILRPCGVVTTFHEQLARGLLQARQTLRLSPCAHTFDADSDLPHVPLPAVTFGADEETVNVVYTVSVYNFYLSHTRNGKHPASIEAIPLRLFE